MNWIVHAYFRAYTEYTPIFLCNPSIIPEICYRFYCKNTEYCSVFPYSEYVNARGEGIVNILISRTGLPF